MTVTSFPSYRLTMVSEQPPASRSPPSQPTIPRTAVLSAFLERDTGFESSPAAKSREISHVDVAPSVVDAHATPRPLVTSIPVDRGSGPAEDSPLERLTRTVAAASAAGEWGVVKAALAELEALRLAAAGPNVVALPARRRESR